MSELVDRAKASLEGVTEGPWEADDHEDDEYDKFTVGAGEYLEFPGAYKSTDLIYEVDTYSIELDSADYAQVKADAEFIAAARQLVPELITEIERLEKRDAERDQEWRYWNTR